MSEQTNYKQALGTLVTVFFFWGFIAASNGVFIPFCKEYFNLSIKDTLATRTVMETSIGISGLLGVLILNYII